MIKRLEVVKQPTKDLKLIYQLKISLDESKPEIWRRVLAPGKMSLDKLHLLIQISMGWDSTHLYEFTIRTKRYINPLIDPDGMDVFPPAFDSRKTRIADVINLNDQFIYEYDFGDGWGHTVIVEAIEVPDEIMIYPVCIDGANACPPEDCGGPHGYKEFLKNLKSKRSDDRNKALAWVGGQFDPTSFDANRVNRDGIWINKW